MARNYYNPADTPLKFMFGGVDFSIPPNAVWEPTDKGEDITGEAIGVHAFGLFEKIGLREVEGNVKATIEAAEATHSTYLRESIGAVLERHAANVKRDTELGLSPRPFPPEVVEARKMAKEWGLLA